MKKFINPGFFIIVILLLSFFSANSQEIIDSYRVIPSITDWVDEVNNWQDSVYEQRYIKILIDPVKDKNHVILNPGFNNFYDSQYDSLDKLVINKEVNVRNIQFGKDETRFEGKAILNLHFKEEFKIYELMNSRILFRNIIFEKLHRLRLIKSLFFVRYYQCHFIDNYAHDNPYEPVNLDFFNCSFKKNVYLSSSINSPSIHFNKCKIERSLIFGNESSFNTVLIDSSNIKSRLDFHAIEISNTFEVSNSTFGLINIDNTLFPPFNTYIPFHQLSKKIYIEKPEPDSIAYYKNPETEDLEDQESYEKLIASYSKVLDVYSVRSEMDSYNPCYVEMRNIQTDHSKLVYQKAPNFSNFLVYQLNVFMRSFSDYGTKPTKAILISIYVILVFAFIYLFFPNSWDSHGKNRIVDRFSFFMKYMNREAGVHEVYLEERKDDILAYDDFKNLIESSEAKVPKFFTKTALPLYKWAISGTRVSSRILKSMDIIKGKWSELPEKNKWWKTILLIGAFSFAFLYDIMIKILNALMLSINTFTTLGFGEIPIKGLPRYLAIIQGFIGWFMLTIFSVSLISQLLN